MNANLKELTRLISRLEAGERPPTSKPGHARVIGITGPPGVGKSTLVDRLITAWRRDNQTVAVIAIDPSSPITGGALLGDRVRMQQHSDDPGVFIRSLATRKHRGGLTESTPAIVRALDAAGFDWVVVETVGAGQNDVEIADVADTVVVLLTPELGDEIQRAKSGLMEIVDILVINKMDLVEGPPPHVGNEGDPHGDAPIRVSARTGDGIDALVAALAGPIPPPPP